MKLKCYSEAATWSGRFEDLSGDDLINAAIKEYNKEIDVETLDEVEKEIFGKRHYSFKEVNIDFKNKVINIMDKSFFFVELKKRTGDYKACRLNDEDCFSNDYPLDNYVDRKKCLTVSKDIKLIDLMAMSEMNKAFNVDVNFRNRLILFNDYIG